MREIVLDTETTGLNPSPDGRGDRLVEIGCVELVDGILTGNNYQCYMNPGRPMSEEAYSVHKLSDEFLSDKPIFSDIAEDFLAFIGDAPLVIHNAEFDMGFINAELVFSGREALPMQRAIDTLMIARSKYSGMKNNLDSLCERLGIDNSHRVAHGALLDAELLAEVYVAMVLGKQSGFGLVAGEKKVSVAVESYDVSGRRGLVVSADDGERDIHEKFVENMENALWKKENA